MKTKQMQMIRTVACTKALVYLLRASKQAELRAWDSGTVQHCSLEADRYRKIFRFSSNRGTLR